ncbi:hypothetical protein NG798_25180 [Ancylothrix sp. C2]|uniref:hypothetical protein n=1 Tax=Ancylothrix sp. D3o TaxID=2953691 RepID=UPI0021BAEF35|nr:hypothetical protein [Ancylothrix sp. D3o]MCT7953095.1 hypothetical protein [Ancylothrix sp. D3o]
MQKCSLGNLTHLVLLTLLGLTAPSVSAQDFPITRIESKGLGHGNIYIGGFKLIVPDTNTTVNAYGNNSRLRRYDVHLAKMFEITMWECSKLRSQNQATAYARWEYKAGNGSIDMGIFEISCPLALDIRRAYGLGQPERTVISNYSIRTLQWSSESADIPRLQITGGKIDRWLDFVEGFKPIR